MITCEKQESTSEFVFGSFFSFSFSWCLLDEHKDWENNSMGGPSLQMKYDP